MVLIRKIRNRAAHVYGLAILLDIFLIRRPVEAAWDTSIHSERGNQVLSYFLLKVFGLLIDLAILATPPLTGYALENEGIGFRYAFTWWFASLICVI